MTEANVQRDKNGMNCYKTENVTNNKYTSIRILTKYPSPIALAHINLGAD